MEVALDANASSDWLRSGLWNRKISQASRIIVSMIVIGELFHGFHGGDRSHHGQLRVIHGFSDQGMQGLLIKNARDEVRRGR